MSYDLMLFRPPDNTNPEVASLELDDILDGRRTWPWREVRAEEREARTRLAGLGRVVQRHRDVLVLLLPDERDRCRARAVIRAALPHLEALAAIGFQIEDPQQDRRLRFPTDAIALTTAYAGF
ncbi:hypothetical protein [Gandjariella thermophila]|uniref:Uncharacterized protein n=1 Tax=Gandjariella thermophila TaxID=1931992 RepID=A0A4D4IZZ3_9PSEU|nr:hypothetical protein [Gandjariella thermophila]GDY29811.1 hypothetical protein GTS_14440 [Gandjariella thermophila]